jgi:putative transcription factor
MSHQDWNPVVFKKRIPKTVKEAKAKGMTTQQHSNKKNINYENTINMRKLENEEVEIKKIDLNLSKLIQKARVNNKLSQKDLADKLNLKSNIIQGYESGKVIPNKTLLYKMGKILNTHLTGKNIGTPMERK